MFALPGGAEEVVARDNKVSVNLFIIEDFVDWRDVRVRGVEGDVEGGVEGGEEGGEEGGKEGGEER
jgi:hypothetical protein